MKALKHLAASTAIFMGLGVTSANAVVIDWIDWNSAGANTASGTLAGGSVAVTYTGSYAFVQNGVTGNLTNYWAEFDPPPYTGNAVVDNAPPGAEGISLSLAGTKTVTFSRPVVNPVFAFNSWNSSGVTQSIDFGTTATILSTGRGFWGIGAIAPAFGGNGWETVSGEPHGVVQLPGTFDSIIFTDAANEGWHGFTIGIERVVPVPPALWLFGIGLASLGLVARRRRTG